MADIICLCTNVGSITLPALTRKILDKVQDPRTSLCIPLSPGTHAQPSQVTQHNIKVYFHTTTLGQSYMCCLLTMTNSWRAMGGRLEVSTWVRGGASGGGVSANRPGPVPTVFTLYKTLRWCAIHRESLRMMGV